ncbi:MAG: ribonuclease III [Coriobacteriia bacterium]|nr:ribonuclease III [Coriobacteriia bacterium]
MTDDLRTRAEELLGYRFSDDRLLAEALTHPSYAAEHGGMESYDRLEFLGDAVLGFIVADRMFRTFPEEPEGDLTKRKHSIVSGAALSPVATALGVGDLLRLGRGADAAGERERPSVLENALEALVGAVYLDGGLEPAREFVAGFETALPTQHASAAADAKSLLQQWTQADSGSLPVYRVVAAEGPPHARTFTVEVSIDERVTGTGTGPSKQAAEKAAAAQALAVLEDADQGT